MGSGELRVKPHTGPGTWQPLDRPAMRRTRSVSWLHDSGFTPLRRALKGAAGGNASSRTQVPRSLYALFGLIRYSRPAWELKGLSLI
jgi:hypothetical protein